MRIATWLALAAAVLVVPASDEVRAHGHRNRHRIAVHCPPPHGARFFVPEAVAPPVELYAPAPSPDVRRAPAPAIVSVSAFDNYFEPQTVTVPVGASVRWMNEGRHDHTVTADGGGWDSGRLAPGAAFMKRFDRPGTYHYYCRFHAQDRMRGTIVVGNAGGRAMRGGAGPARSGAAAAPRSGY